MREGQRFGKGDLLVACDCSIQQAQLQKCRVNAPFSSRVVNLPAHEHQYLEIGDPIMEIINDSQLELKLIVPSLWLRWLKPGLAAG